MGGTERDRDMDQTITLRSTTSGATSPITSFPRLIQSLTSLEERKPTIYGWDKAEPKERGANLGLIEFVLSVVSRPLLIKGWMRIDLMPMAAPGGEWRPRDAPMRRWRDEGPPA